MNDKLVNWNVISVEKNQIQFELEFTDNFLVSNGEEFDRVYVNLMMGDFQTSRDGIELNTFYSVTAPIPLQTQS